MNINRANLSCKNGLKRENRDKGQHLAPNSEDPFNKVEEGLKKRHITVYDQVQNSSKISLKYHAKIGLKESLNTMEEEETSNSKRSPIKNDKELKI